MINEPRKSNEAVNMEAVETRPVEIGRTTSRATFAAGRKPRQPPSPTTADRARLGTHTAVLALCTAIAFVMARRDLFIARDDEAYLAGFRLGADRAEGWIGAVEEPIWTFYCDLFSGRIDPAVALRFTIFASTLGFLYAMFRLSPRAWAIVLLGFTIDAALGVQMYFNQLRQGCALTCFIACLAIFRRRMNLGLLLAGFLATQIHSSFFITIPCALAAILSERRKWALPLCVAAAVVLPLVFRSQLAQLEFGRRSSFYAFEASVNANFFIAAIAQYGLILYLIYQGIEDAPERLLFRLTLLSALSSLAICSVYEAGARLFYIVNGLVLLLIARSIPKLSGVASAVIWFTILMLLNFNEARKLDFNVDSWTGKWALILNS